MDNFILGIPVTNTGIAFGIAITAIIILTIICISLLQNNTQLKYKVDKNALAYTHLKECQKQLQISHQYDIRILQFIYQNGDYVNPQKDIIMKRNGNYYGFFYVKEGRKQIEVFLYKQN